MRAAARTVRRNPGGLKPGSGHARLRLGYHQSMNVIAFTKDGKTSVYSKHK